MTLDFLVKFFRRLRLKYILQLSKLFFKYVKVMKTEKDRNY